MVRLQITLDPREADALARWAALELREPREQIRFVVRELLLERGLLPPEPPAHAQQAQPAQAVPA